MYNRPNAMTINAMATNAMTIKNDKYGGKIHPSEWKLHPAGCSIHLSSGTNDEYSEAGT